MNEPLVLSASSIQQFLQCGLRYRFARIDKLEPAFRPSALAFGAALHTTAETAALERVENRDPDPNAIVALWRSDWDAMQEENIRFRAGETPESLAVLGDQLIRLFVGWVRTQKVISAEEPFEVDLVDPETGEVIDGIRLRGFLDMLLDDGDGNRIVGELKSASRRFDDATLATKIQFSAYLYAIRRRAESSGEGSPVPAGLRVITLLKHKVPSLSVATVTRTQRQEAWFVHLVAGVATAIRSGAAFVPNPSPMNCLGCEFAVTACSVWRGEAANDDGMRRRLDVVA